MACDQRVSRMRERFYTELQIKRASTNTKNRVYIDEQRYDKLLNEINAAKVAKTKSSRDYWLLKHYDSIIVGQKYKLIFPLDAASSKIIYYITDSELFDTLHETHLNIGHGGRDRMIKELSTRYKNITRHDIELYLQLCESCQQKQKGVKKGKFEFNSRCQIDLIDFQAHPDRDYKFIMVYQDYLTKFVILKALKSKEAEEVAYNLLDIFTLIGAPAILQSDNGREFAKKIVYSLKKYWPALKIVHGKFRHSQSQNVEHVSEDIESMVTTWMQDNDNEHWSDGLRFIQLMKNRAVHSGMKRTPYEALFGTKMNVGISLPPDTAQNIESEEDLANVLQILPKESTSTVTTTNQPETHHNNLILDGEVKFCIVSSCKNNNRNKNLFNLPTATTVESANRRKLWLTALSNKKKKIDLDEVLVCSDHFLLKCPCDDPTHIDYIPTLNLTSLQLKLQVSNESKPEEIKTELSEDDIPSIKEESVDIEECPVNTKIENLMEIEKYEDKTS